MRATLAVCALAIGFGAGPSLVACTADIHGNTVNATVPTDVTISTSADANAVKPGESLPLHVQMSGSSTTTVADAGSTGTGDAASTGGASAPAPTQVNVLFQIFIDAVGDTPLVVTAQADFSVTIPPSTSPGHHKVICRVAQGDGTPTNVTSSIDINVTSS